jgi:hypothetical protein
VCGQTARVRAAPQAWIGDFSNKNVDVGGIRLCTSRRMASSTPHVERLWSMADGTFCLLVEREDAPRFEICVVRGDEVLRQNHLYARGSAQMLAETWRSNLLSASAQRPSIAC